ncbi:MAG: hypothetical protein P1P85_04330 [Patescibacteria group bacterium]|nr:hypothetical protein [Patescibacteria group bacterium]
MKKILEKIIGYTEELFIPFFIVAIIVICWNASPLGMIVATIIYYETAKKVMSDSEWDKHNKT